MSKSGLADSPFFSAPISQPKPEPVPQPVTEPKVEKVATPVKKLQKPRTENVVQKSDTDAVLQEHNENPMLSDNARMQSNMQASNNASMQALNQESIIETIRKAVKGVGKDSATYRFTPEEKKAMLEISFSYKMQGYKTSENELVRIAINFILEDQKQNGRNSVLQKVLDELSK
jgi:hypothetical protein